MLLHIDDASDAHVESRRRILGGLAQVDLGEEGFADSQLLTGGEIVEGLVPAFPGDVGTGSQGVPQAAPTPRQGRGPDDCGGTAPGGPDTEPRGTGRAARPPQAPGSPLPNG